MKVLINFAFIAPSWSITLYHFTKTSTETDTLNKTIHECEFHDIIDLWNAYPCYEN